MGKEIISTDRAPAAIGAYSQAVRAGDKVFVSGQIPFTPEGEPVTGDIETKTRQVLDNLQAILEAAGCRLEDTVKVTIYTTDMDNFAAVNKVYGNYFAAQPPARAFVEVSGLPKNADLEIEATAHLED